MLSSVFFLFFDALIGRRLAAFARTESYAEQQDENKCVG
jgi:hypothetical protein